MQLRTLDDEDTNIWKETCTEKYERRPPHLEDVTLSQFSAHYYIKRDGSYARRSVPRIIMYIGYDPAKQRDYQRETVLLNHPFRSEVADILDCDKFVTIYNDNKVLLHERMREFSSNLDIQKTIQICEALHVTEPHQAHETSALNTGAEQAKRHAAEAELAQHELRTKMMRPNNDDIFAAAKTKLSAVVKKRDNIMSAEEFRYKFRMHTTIWSSVETPNVFNSVAKDVMIGYKDANQEASTRSKIHKMTVAETAGLAYKVSLVPEKKYMITANIDVVDGLTNGSMCTLKHIELQEDGLLHRVWVQGDSH
ncbi:hypothetical protein MTO96_001179 [Rhipicephalus appendiculatus]